MKKFTTILLMTMMMFFVFLPVATASTIDIGNVTGECTWSLTDGVLKISGSGKMDDYRFQDEDTGSTFFVQTPWSFKSWQTGQKIEKVVIEKGVTYIGEAAFMQCSNLLSVTIPNTVLNIGNYAFNECDSLKSITLPNSLTNIGDYTFSNCDSLKSITLPNSLTNIGDYAFSNCDSLKSITFPNSLTNIGDYAFNDCTSLTDVFITNLTAWCKISFGNYSSNPIYYAKKLYVNNILAKKNCYSR